MPELIDKELERVSKLGQTPKTIYVGIGLYDEIRNEQSEPIAADIVADGQEVPVFPPEKPREYKGIKLHVMETAEPNYLSIET